MGMGMWIVVGMGCVSMVRIHGERTVDAKPGFCRIFNLGDGDRDCDNGYKHAEQW